jgi:hypothetical protein
MTSTRVSSKPSSPEAVLSHIEPGADIVMPNANGEPVELVDTLEEQAEELSGVRIHQMQALRERRYINGEFGDPSALRLVLPVDGVPQGVPGRSVRSHAEPLQ